jgi:hypothetical protein
MPLATYFLLDQKVGKKSPIGIPSGTASKESLKTYSITLQKNNSLIAQTNFSATLHYVSFLNVTAFAGSRCGGAFLLRPNTSS